MFVAMGLGSITKGPVALLLPVLVILIFLFSARDLKWLGSMDLKLGIAIWLLVMLGWFIPALTEGGREFFDIVVYDEMVNRFFGIGTRASKTQPFYYLASHFFGKFLPWSLFVPSSIAGYWRLKDKTEKNGLLFPIVWLGTFLIFFSLSKGKRSDYILPLYPAVSVMIGWLWFSCFERNEAFRWKNHLKRLSLVYLLGCFSLAVGLLVLFTRPELAQVIGNRFLRGYQKMKLLRDSVSTRPDPLLITVLPLAVASILGIAVALRRNVKLLFLAVSATSMLYLSVYFRVLSPDAVTRDGEKKKAFCFRAAQRIDAMENLGFLDVQNSILFYTGRNVQPLNRDRVLTFFRSVNSPYLITTEGEYLGIRDRADFEVNVLETSKHLVGDERKYLLLKRGSSKRQVIKPGAEIGNALPVTPTGKGD